MLEKEIFNKFISEINKMSNQFFVWMYANNNFVKHQSKFNQGVSRDWCFSTDEYVDKSCQYKNFWNVIIPSLQHSWLLSTSRLIDPAYFVGDKNKEKPRLSIYYILELLEDDELEQEIKKGLLQYNDFFKSIKGQRNNFLAHNDLKFDNIKIKAGIEKFLESLDKIIAMIKDKKPHLRDCNCICIERTDKLSNSGVKEIFEKLV